MSAKKAATNEGLKIAGSVQVAELDIKRFYLPGLRMKQPCPKCGKSHETDFNTEHLSYPAVGADFDHTMYCGECEHEWAVSLRLTLRLAPAKESV